MDPKFDRLASFFLYAVVGIFLAALIYRTLPEPFGGCVGVGVFLGIVLFAQIRFKFFRRVIEKLFPMSVKASNRIMSFQFL